MRCACHSDGQALEEIPFSSEHPGEFVVLLYVLNVITTEASGDKAIFKTKQMEIAMRTMNPGLFPKAPSTTSAAPAMDLMELTTHPRSFRVSQSMLQKSSSGGVSCAWSLLDYLLNK